MGIYYKVTVQLFHEAEEVNGVRFREGWQNVAEFDLIKAYSFARHFGERATRYAMHDEWQQRLDEHMDESAYQQLGMLLGPDFMAVAVVHLKDDEDAPEWEKRRLNAIGAFIHTLVNDEGSKASPDYKNLRVFVHQQT